MRTQFALALAVLASLQTLRAEGIFENVEARYADLPHINWNEGPQALFNKQEDEDISDRIVGGVEVPPHSEPHQVALKLKLADGREAFCGGSLIDGSWVVTAAHCTDDVTEITVVAGAHNIKTDEPEARAQKVERILPHPKWDRYRIKNDIALLKLPAQFNLDEKFVKTIRLPSEKQKGQSFWRSPVTMSGWGKDSDKSTTVSPVLRSVNSKVVSNLYCSFRYFFQVITDTNICVSGWRGKGTCNGDSGGPLYVVEADGEKTLIGVTSFGIALGCEWSWPPAFTRVSAYVDWIHETTGIATRP